MNNPNLEKVVDSFATVNVDGKRYYGVVWQDEPRGPFYVMFENKPRVVEPWDGVENWKLVQDV